MGSKKGACPAPLPSRLRRRWLLLRPSAGIFSRSRSFVPQVPRERAFVPVLWGFRFSGVGVWSAVNVNHGAAFSYCGAASFKGELLFFVFLVPGSCPAYRACARVYRVAANAAIFHSCHSSRPICEPDGPACANASGFGFCQFGPFGLQVGL